MSVVEVLDRLHTRRLAQRLGFVTEPVTALGSDSDEVAQLLSDAAFNASVAALAKRLGRDDKDVLAEAAMHLRGMSATHGERATESWRRFGAWFLRAYDLLVDEEQAARLRALDRKGSLALIFSHRSYLDGWVLPNALAARGFSPTYTFGGANLNLAGIGTLASRTGVIFIRRDTSELPVYRFALRSFIAQLVRNERNVGWSIEGGRTRTGKLRPPVYGILRYLADAVEEAGGDNLMLVPVSVVYDQLHEVAGMTAEARGGRKRPEDLRWLVQFGRLQRKRLGRAYLTFGEPVPLRARLAELHAEGADEHAVERIALDVSHRINRATPVTVTAIVSLALLGADRALTLDQVLTTVEPLALYIHARNWPVAGAATLTDRSTVRQTLQELVSSGVLTSYDGGTEPVWGIGPEQHLIAAFYRNTAIHILVDRAIGEVALLAAAESKDSDEAMIVAWHESLRLRELLKFEFFFASRDEFEAEMRMELDLLAPQHASGFATAEAGKVLADIRPHLAHLVLRPYLDAYHVLADCLAAAGDEPIEDDALLAESLRVGRQWELQRRVASAESVSLELFKTALRLARHRGLLTDSTDAASDLGTLRREFADEVRESVRRVGVIAALGAAIPSASSASRPRTRSPGSRSPR